uniref:Uncharacterized protein n=1 Tax=Acrobeloides nanus TaxID=290746 RepID=A0A914D6S1_9BILA
MYGEAYQGIFGLIISIIIPPNGFLSVEYSADVTRADVVAAILAPFDKNIYFTDMSPNYPYDAT